MPDTDFQLLLDALNIKLAVRFKNAPLKNAIKIFLTIKTSTY